MKTLTLAIAVLLVGCTTAQTQPNEKPSAKEVPVKQYEVTLTEAEWRAKLTPEEFRILRQKGTEYAGTGKYNNHKAEGTYNCGGCGTALFSSDHKYNSGSGWPSYFKPINEEAVAEERDVSYGMIRTEVLCATCGGHLGHVFTDGPRDKTGLRYCINSASLDFEPEKDDN